MLFLSCQTVEKNLSAWYSVQFSDQESQDYLNCEVKSGKTYTVKILKTETSQSSSFVYRVYLLYVQRKMKAAAHNRVENKPGKTCWKFWSWKYFPLQHTPHHLTKQTQELNQKTYSSKQGQYRWCTLHHHKQQQTFHLDYGSNSAFRSTWSISFGHQLACNMTHSHDKI